LQLKFTPADRPAPLPDFQHLRFMAAATWGCRLCRLKPTSASERASTFGLTGNGWRSPSQSGPGSETPARGWGPGKGPAMSPRPQAGRLWGSGTAREKGTVRRLPGQRPEKRTACCQPVCPLPWGIN